MILKIARNYGSSIDPAPHIVVECDRYDVRAYNKADDDAEATESMFCDQDGKVEPTQTIVTYVKRKFADLFVLGNATVFAMNNDGKTVEIIYT